MFFQNFWRGVQKRFFRSSNRIEEYEKLLETILIDMQEDLIQLRQVVAQAIASQKRIERQIVTAETTADEWHQRVQAALNRGDEALAKEALMRKISYQEIADSMAEQLETGRPALDTMKSALITLEFEVSKLKTKKDIFIARVRFLDASESMFNHLSGLSSIPNPIFEELEKSFSQLVTQSNSPTEFYKDAQDQQSGDSKDAYDINAELEAIKKQMFQD